MSVAPRRLPAVAAIIAVVAAVMIAPPTFATAPHAGQLQIRGPGSYFTDSSVVSKVVDFGRTASYPLKLVNTGTTVAQYRLTLAAEDNDGFRIVPATRELYVGAQSVTALAESGGGYYTVALKPGQSQLLTLKVRVAARSAVPPGVWGTAVTRLHFYATDGTQLDETTAVTEVQAPATTASDPSHASDVFARQGTQPFVGGISFKQQVSTAPAVGAGGTAVFKIKVQNNAADPHAIQVRVFVAPCVSLVVKSGTADVTAALRAETYFTPVLSEHQSVLLTATFTRTSASGEPCSALAFGSFEAFILNPDYEPGDSSPWISRSVAVAAIPFRAGT